MQKTDTLIKIVSVIVFIAIVFYIGYYLYEAQTDPLVTAAVMEHTIKESASTEGYAIRTEEYLDVGTARVLVTAEESEKLAAGSTYAMKFASRESMEASEKARELEMQIQWLENLANEGDSAAEDMAKDSVRALAYSLDSGNISSLDQLLSDINVKVFQSGDYSGDSIQEELDSVREQLEVLEENLGTDMERLTVKKAGVFSGYIDGFEDITPDQLVDITPDGLSQLFSSPNAADSSTLGKLVTDISWRYAAVMASEDAMKLKNGDNVTLEFSKTYNDTITMKVESIGASTNGRCVVVFVSDRNLADIIAIRELTADIVFSMTRGIRIPNEAVHEDEESGKLFVYVISGVQAQRVDITILTEYDDYYLVESNGNLREGMEVIVEAKELYSGKVVR